jgi:hypothetical protein
MQYCSNPELLRINMSSSLIVFSSKTVCDIWYDDKICTVLTQLHVVADLILIGPDLKRLPRD